MSEVPFCSLTPRCSPASGGGGGYCKPHNRLGQIPCQKEPHLPRTLQQAYPVSGE